MVINGHMHWDKRNDFVKYAQGYNLLKNIGKFVKKNEVDLNETPIIICGDFNSGPESSLIHLMNGKDYQLDVDDRYKMDAYKTEAGK